MFMKDCRTQEARRQKAKLQKRAEIANRCSVHTIMTFSMRMFTMMKIMSIEKSKIRFSIREGGVAELLARSHRYRQYCFLLVF